MCWPRGAEPAMKTETVWRAVLVVENDWYGSQERLMHRPWQKTELLAIQDGNEALINAPDDASPKHLGIVIERRIRRVAQGDS